MLVVYVNTFLIFEWFRVLDGYGRYEMLVELLGGTREIFVAYILFSFHIFICFKYTNDVEHVILSRLTMYFRD